MTCREFIHQWDANAPKGYYYAKTQSIKGPEIIDTLIVQGLPFSSFSFIALHHFRAGAASCVGASETASCTAAGSSIG